MANRLSNWYFQYFPILMAYCFFLTNCELPSCYMFITAVWVILLVYYYSQISNVSFYFLTLPIPPNRQFYVRSFHETNHPAIAGPTKLPQLPEKTILSFFFGFMLWFGSFNKTICPRTFWSAGLLGYCTGPTDFKLFPNTDKTGACLQFTLGSSRKVSTQLVLSSPD